MATWRVCQTCLAGVAIPLAAAAGFQRGDRVRQAVLEPDFSTTDWAANCAEYPEHDTDHHKDAADGVKNRKACEVTNQEKDDAEHDHGQSDPVPKFGTGVRVIARS